MKKTVALSALLMVSACAGGAQPIDAQKVLSGMEGPKVQSFDDAMMESAKKAENEGDFKQASVYYQQILEKKPEDKDIALALADSFRRSGSPDKAIALYDGLIAKDPTMVAAKEGKGLALMAKGDFDMPGQLFDEVMKVDARRWKTLNALGILFSTRNMQPEAQQYFNEALKYHEASPTILNNLGLSQALNRNFKTAIDSLQKASGLATPLDRKRIDLNTALVYASAGKLDEARALAENYLSDAALDNNLGLYAHLAKDDQMARAYLNMALTQSKFYYAKAWDNLQDISTSGNDNEAVAKHKAKPKPKPADQDATPKMTKLPADLFPENELPATE